MLKFISSMVLGADHSIMVNNMPTGVKLEAFSKDYFKAAHKDSQSVEKFGLFGGNVDYNTYYPEASQKDFNAEQDDFIEPVFRLLSACIVSKNYMPTEFPADVLRASMPLLVGQTVNCDHETKIGNAIGSVKEVSWQESYEDNGISIPAGINGVLKIDAKANHRIARGINMDHPSVHSNSVTVQFEWKPSHEFHDPYTFWDKLGTYDEKGEMVRRIATKIISYKETSLVSHGADPYAQKVSEGKIINPGYADSVYNSFSEKIKEKMSRNSSYQSFKEISSVDPIHDTSYFNNEGGNSNSNINNHKNNENMPTLQEFLDQLFGGEGMLILAEGASASIELAFSEIKSLVRENSDYKAKVSESEAKITDLTNEIATLKDQAQVNEPYVNIGKDHFNEVREATLASYKKLGGEDQNIIELIGKMDSLATLKSFRESYDKQLAEKFPLHCADCGSKNINRASSISNNSEDPAGVNGGTVADSLADLVSKK